MIRSFKEMFRDAPDVVMPSAHQEETWGQYIDMETAPDGKGAFSGWCPIHDKERKDATALFYFKAGIMVCLGKPSCHEGKKSISLTNVALRMIRDAE